MDNSGHDFQLCWAVESKLDHDSLAVDICHNELGGQQTCPGDTQTRDNHLDLTPCPDRKGGCYTEAIVGCCPVASTIWTIAIVKSDSAGTTALSVDIVEFVDVEGKRPGGEDNTGGETSGS